MENTTLSVRVKPLPSIRKLSSTQIHAYRLTLTNLIEPYVTEEKHIAWDDVRASFNLSMESSIPNHSVEQLKKMWGRKADWPEHDRMCMSG